MEQCKYSGTVHIARQCPAKCNKCNVRNKIAKMCTLAARRIQNQEPQKRPQKPVKIVSKKPTRSVHRIDESTFSDGEYSIYSVSYSGQW